MAKQWWLLRFRRCMSLLNNAYRGRCVRTSKGEHQPCFRSRQLLPISQSNPSFSLLVCSLACGTIRPCHAICASFFSFFLWPLSLCYKFGCPFSNRLLVPDFAYISFPYHSFFQRLLVSLVLYTFPYSHNNTLWKYLLSSSHLQPCLAALHSQGLRLWISNNSSRCLASRMTPTGPYQTLSSSKTLSKAFTSQLLTRSSALKQRSC